MNPLVPKLRLHAKLIHPPLFRVYCVCLCLLTDDINAKRFSSTPISSLESRVHVQAKLLVSIPFPTTLETGNPIDSL